MRTLPDPGSDAAHILVVDDEPQIRDLLSTVLEREGYRVTGCADGETALQAIREQTVDVVVTDLKMPRMSGLDLIRTAKGIRPDLGSILITGYASTETAIQALRFGADDFVRKPFSLDDLRRVVDRVLSARRMLTQERDALDRAREEAETLRRRSREVEEALESAQRDLRLSRRDLERRVRDLAFVNDLTSLLAKEEDLQRVLETTARIVTARFQAHGTRIEVVLHDGTHMAQHQLADAPTRRLAAIGPGLVARARHSPEGVARDLVLGGGPPMEALAAPLDISLGPVGGISLVRPATPGADAGDLFLLSMVPRALAVGVEADLQRRTAVRSALGVATGILEALEGRGSLHKGHAERVARLSKALSEAMGLSSRLSGVIETAARLHDVGEVGVPDRVLQHGGPLGETDREVIRCHPILGARILAPFGEAALFVRHHHERPDGLGYPDGLQGDEIPVGSGIIAVAEAYDAMTHHRPYRQSRPRAEALDEIRELRGKQFVPEVVDALLSLPAERL
ncbi:MAG: response regulator [Planctomycetota bacterium]|jgi:response regulator RpfG family c-di-GMP phosphodiesterase